MITADIWRRYYKPWTKKLVDEAKKYELLACFHGGIDGQKLIPLGTPKRIREEVRRIKDIYMDGRGGIIMGPSHHITPDTPIENILAIYQS